MAEPKGSSGNEIRFVRRVIVTLALTALAIAIWHLRELLMLVFGAVVLATLFRALSEPLRRMLRLPDWAALTLAVALIVAAIGAAVVAFGPEIGAQVRGLVRNLPAAWQSLEDRISAFGIGPLPDSPPVLRGIWSNLGRFALSLGGALVTALLIIAGAIYFAAQPGLYRSGLVMLFPEHRRPLVDEALGDSGRALMLWLRGQMITMSVVGTLTGLGLWLIGMPSALALGLLAGLLDFVPFIGPITAAIPALLIAFNISGEMFLWTLALYVVVQQLEGNFLYPLVQSYEVGIPPALLLFALIAAGALFGWPGVLLAAPLTVVSYVLIKRLYVREVLHTPTEVPGEIPPKRRTRSA